MRLVKRCPFVTLGAGLFLCLDLRMVEGQAQWHLFYRVGLRDMERSDWKGAIENFQKAVSIKERDSKKTRATGVMFIEYFPHREMGICHFHLGNFARAKQELTISVSHQFSERAKNYLDRINRGESVSGEPPPTVAPQATTLPAASLQQPPPEPASSALVGECLSIAVLPFESKGIGGEVQNRFAALERIRHRCAG